MVLCLLWMVLGPSSLTLVLTLAEPAMVFILLELRELEELGVCSVPEGLSATSCDEKILLILSQLAGGLFLPEEAEGVSCGARRVSGRR